MQLLDFKKKCFKFSNYGHPPQYLYHEKDGKIEKLNSMTGLLGLPVEKNDVFEEETEFDDGDKILLYTDGVTETVNSENEEYGDERLEKFLKKDHKMLGKQFNEKLLNDLNEFKTGDFADDVCILSMNIKPHPSLFNLGTHIFKHDG